MMQQVIGIIQQGKFTGRKIILPNQKDIYGNVYLVEDGIFFNGAPLFQKACLACEEFVGDTCEKCYTEAE